MKKIFKLDDAKKNLRRAALIAIGAFSLSATQMQAQDGNRCRTAKGDLAGTA